MNRLLAALVLAGVATVALAQSTTNCTTTGNVTTCTTYNSQGGYCTTTCVTSGASTSCQTYGSACR